MHALNNAIGESVLTPALMPRACGVFLFEMEVEGNPEQRRDHEIPASGWYSEAVLATVLRVHANIYSLDLDNPIQPQQPSALRIFAPDTLGVVVNRGNVHWFAYKSINGEIWVLDSMKDPHTVTFDGYKDALRTYTGAFAVVRLPRMA